jgi:hypothetical protein
VEMLHFQMVFQGNLISANLEIGITLPLSQ